MKNIKWNVKKNEFDNILKKRDIIIIKSIKWKRQKIYWKIKIYEISKTQFTENNVLKTSSMFSVSNFMF